MFGRVDGAAGAGPAVSIVKANTTTADRTAKVPMQTFNRIRHVIGGMTANQGWRFTDSGVGHRLVSAYNVRTVFTITAPKS